LSQELRFAGVDTPIREFGIPPEFLEHGSRAELLEQLGLTPQQIARSAVEAVVRERDAPGQGADSARL
jgi:1-deoxy-D-xylulose-5-phosphate synthase